jgi:hypothetical protein
MKRYGNKSGSSGVTAYELGRDSISVMFVGGAVYLYTQRSCGKRAIIQMKKLAVAGKGLATYISSYLKDKYEQQLA